MRQAGWSMVNLSSRRDEATVTLAASRPRIVIFLESTSLSWSAKNTAIKVRARKGTSRVRQPMMTMALASTYRDVALRRPG